jgi:TnpA family transposase
MRMVNAQFKQPFAAYWGEGTTSSSDGQRFRAGGRGEASGQINARYGGEPASIRGYEQVLVPGLSTEPKIRVKNG